MTSRDAFAERGRSLEEAYFRTKDAELVEKLRAVFENNRSKAELRTSTGITNEVVLDRLVALHLGGELLTAFRLYPLVEIAWADGTFDKKEAAAVIAAATKMGVPRDSMVLARLEEWLHHGPTEDFRNAWKMFAAELRKTLSPAELTTFREDLLKYAHQVAETSGGVFDMFLQVSSNERAIIAKIHDLLT